MSQRTIGAQVTEQAEVIDPATLLEFEPGYRSDIRSAARLADGRLWLDMGDCEVIWPAGGVAGACSHICDVLVSLAAAKKAA